MAAKKRLINEILYLDQAEKGGMVPLKGNLWNLVEMSILGCWAR